MRTRIRVTATLLCAIGLLGAVQALASQDAPRSAPAAALAADAGPAGAAEILARFDRFEVISRGPEGSRAGAYMTAPDMVRFIKDAESGAAAPTERSFAGRGAVAIAALVFAGGLALNLTPCVLPMIPINLAILGAGTQSRNRRRGFALGSAYGAAMAAAYGALGLVVVLAGATFGAVNSTAWFNALIAAVFAVLGLAMFDVVTIDFSRWSGGVRFDASSRGTFLLAYGMGTVAALLAGACVAPIVVQVVVFSSQMYASGRHAALALPLVLGLGMACPWPFAGAGLAWLPKPGAWMLRVKQVLGLFVLATSAYYGFLAYRIVDSRRAAPTVERTGALHDGWYRSVEAGLDAAARDRSLVFVDFWASWCRDCVVMDATTLRDPTVLEALKGYTRIKYHAEDIAEPPVGELLDRFESIGLPAYVILKPK